LRLVLIEARVPRRAAAGYARNGGTLPELARELRITRRKARGFLDGEYHFLTPAVLERLLRLLNPKSRAWVEENARRYPVHPGKMPLEVLAPVVREAVEEAGGITALAHETGVAARRIFAVLHGLEQQVGLPVADRLLTRSLGPDRWREEPALRRWYWSSDSNRVLH